jgi:hypothetical protein
MRTYSVDGKDVSRTHVSLIAIITFNTQMIHYDS